MVGRTLTDLASLVPTGAKKAEMVATVSSLADPETNEVVALEMVKSGLARLERASRRGFASKTEEVAALVEEEEAAKKAHLNMWEYGDIGSDDEDDRPPGWGRR